MQGTQSMITNAFWVLLFIALVAGASGAAYYVGQDRGEDRGRKAAMLSAEEASYFDASVSRLVELGYTWTGESWSAPSSTSAAAVPQPTREPDRTSCEEIEGTQYRSPGERTFFLTNCVSVPITPTPLCGSPPNPWCYDLFPGELISTPPSDFCGYFECAQNFWTGTGYVVRCQNGSFSKTGGEQNACSANGGVSQPLYSH